MTRTYIKELKEHIGKEISISGWVDIRRDHGKLIFIDIRDMSGKIQAVALPNNKEAHEVANKIRSEWIIKAEGIVNKRPEKMIAKDKVTGEIEPNGDIELELKKIEILNEAQTPPIDVRGDGKEIGEEARLKYRYLDLRRPRLQKNIRNRSAVTLAVRNAFVKDGFTEIETPYMSATTPEGSRDYVVPSRLENGKFYSLPQSPQQYKQLLMTAGFERYFQFARCFRDEDMEMSFVEMKDVMAINEKIMIETINSIYPEKVIQQIPFPVMTYKEVMEKYGVDKPDIRKDKNDPNLLAFLWVIDWPFFEKDDEGKWTFTHNPFSAPQPQHMNMLMEKKDIENILTTQYDMVLNGNEVAGGSIRNHRPEALKKVFEIMGYEEERIQKNFGHMISALGSGTPPHGGIAWGFDRLIMLLENEPNIREVIAFSKTGEGKDLMMGAPSDIPEKQMRELGIELRKKK